MERMESVKKGSIAMDTYHATSMPPITMADGVIMPPIGMGTFGSDSVPEEIVADSVKTALEMGYRHIDCARAYGNEKAIGKAFHAIFSDGAIRREDVRITSKLWNDRHGARDVLVSCAETLRDLQLDYLDLYLVHWPFPNYHTPGCDVNERDIKARPFFAQEYLKVWHQMEKLVDLGLVRAIGTSNMTIPKFEQVYPHMRIRPVANQMELHPHLQQKELRAYLAAHDILPIAFCPLGSPNRPQRDRTVDDTCDLTDPVICAIASAHGIHPAEVCLKWEMQIGAIPVPFSTSPKHMMSNLDSSQSAPLTKDEMEAIARIDRNCRLVKGQTLLWHGADNWEILWDLEGNISIGEWSEG